MASEEIFSQLSLRMVTFFFKRTPFASTNLSYFYLCGSGSVFRIRIPIYKAPEYGSNFDPWIHNPGCCG